MHRFKLHLLDFSEPLPLPGYQVINFLVKMPDFKFSFKVDTIVALRSQAILYFLPLLTHHNDWGLQRGKTGQDQIEQNVRIGIEPAWIGNCLIIENPDE